MGRPKKEGDSASLGWKSSRPKPRDATDLTGIKVTKAEIPVLDTVDAKVDFIEDLMRLLRWESGRSAKHCASVWVQDITTVGKYAAEASRRVRSSVHDGDEVTQNVCAGLMLLFDEAVRARDARAAATLAREWAVIAGAKAPNRLLRLNATVTAELDPKEAAQALQQRAKEATAAAFKKIPYSLNEHNSASEFVTTIDESESVPAGTTAD